MSYLQNLKICTITLVCISMNTGFLSGQTSKSIVSTFTYGLEASKNDFDFTFSTVENNSTTISFDYGAKNALGFANLSKGEKTYQKYGLLGISVGETQNSTLELNPRFNISQISQGSTLNHFRITGIYEIGKYLYKSNGNKFRINTGLALYPNYQNYSSKPAMPAQFPYRHQVLNLSIGVNAGLEYSLSDKTAIQFSIPVNIIDVYYSRFHYDNPFIVERDRTVNEIGSVLKFGDVGLALGLSFSL